MKKLLDNIVQFPVDAQSSGFFCAFATAALAAKGEDGRGDDYCGRKRTICADCGECGEKTMLQRHHLSLYHRALTYSGVGLLWADANENGIFSAPYSGSFEPSVEDRLDFCCRTEGLGFEYIDAARSRESVFAEIAAGIDAGRPTLAKLGDGGDWQVFVGYDETGMTLYGVDCRKHWSVKPTFAPDGYTEDGLFYTAGWYEAIKRSPAGRAAVIYRSGKALSPEAIISRMAAALQNNGGEALREKVRALLESGGGDDKRASAEWLNNLAGYSVECRWHAAECFTARLWHTFESVRTRELLGDMTDMYLRFHDLCWKIWGLLGVGPETGFALAADAEERMTRAEVRTELLGLFERLFELDRVVYEKLLEIKH